MNRWITHEAYSEIHQLVDDTGRIIGEVSGSRFNDEQGWLARDESGKDLIRIGRYVDCESAKRAVEKSAKGAVDVTNLTSAGLDDPTTSYGPPFSFIRLPD